MKNFKKALKPIVSLLLILLLTSSIVSPAFAAAAGVGKYRITSSNGLNVRKSTSTASAKVTVIPYNKIVKVTSVSNGWGKVTYNGKTGWILLQYATRNGTYKVTAKSGLHLRKGSGTSYGSLLVIPYNAKVSVNEVKNNWGYTTYKGKSGWISLTYADLTGK
jgi:N-acetylmuramoyl-L-alanine amidase